MRLVKEAIDRIANELRSDPERRGYPTRFPYSYDDVVAAYSLLTADVYVDTVRVPVSVWVLKQKLILGGIWVKLEICSAGHPDSSIRALCKTILGYIDDVRATIVDLDNPEVVRMIDALVASEVISASDRSIVLGLADTRLSKPYCEVKLGISSITIDDVWSASR
ncbi:MAG: hypothetical protein QXG97_00145 [Nitrososphaerota archaeon]